jgi:DNA polymerase III subunit epsilon
VSAVEGKRIVVLDTETTGLEAAAGHRIIEIGCVELIERRPTGRTLHEYFDPERDIDAGAQAVHGISVEDLAGKPKFAERADQIVAFLRDAEIVIHNAAFDVGFLNAEFARVGVAQVHTFAQITDSLMLARAQFPAKKNSLDALCERLGIDNSGRTFHGALLDAQLLADVYLAMTRGQDSLSMDFDDAPKSLGAESAQPVGELTVLRASTEEIATHEKLLDGMAKKAAPIWRAEVAASNA